MKQEGTNRTKVVALVVIIVLAVAAAIFSATRSLRASKGKAVGTIEIAPGGKAALIEGQQGEEAPAGASEGPTGAGMESPGSEDREDR